MEKGSSSSTKNVEPDFTEDVDWNFEDGKTEKNWMDYMDQTIRTQRSDVCWAIATANVVEARYNIMNPDRDGVVLSAQMLIDELTSNKNEDSVHSTKKAFSFVSKYGLCKECLWPFAGKEKTKGEKKDITNNPQIYKNTIKISGYHEQDPMDDRVKDKDLLNLLQDGPVIGFLEFCAELVAFRGQGFYTGPRVRGKKGKVKFHAVTIFGYGRDENGNGYWLIKNSYGKEWGNGGLAKIPMHLDDGQKSVFGGYGYPW